MTQDKRADVVEAMAREMLGRVNAPEQEIYRVAGDLADIALKAAADEVQGLAGKWNREWRAGYKANSHLEGKSDGADEAAEAIRALTSEGTKP